MNPPVSYLAPKCCTQAFAGICRNGVWFVYTTLVVGTVPPGSWLGAILLFTIASSGCTDDGLITLAVINDAGQPIQTVVAKYTGGIAKLGPLKVGERQETTINPAGESHIELDIYPAGGKVEHRLVDTYFEAGYRGKIEISIKKEFVIHSSEHLSH
jgi:hypothetical protein